jgi:hypothetical protein
VAREGQGPEITRVVTTKEQPGRAPMVGKLDKDQMPASGMPACEREIP